MVVAALADPSIARPYSRAWIETPDAAGGRRGTIRIARPYSRAWIETTTPIHSRSYKPVSPNLIAGRGLKHAGGDEVREPHGIARPYSRAWIETNWV